MSIKITYSCDSIEKRHIEFAAECERFYYSNSFNIKKYNDIKYLKCSDCKLTNLPELPNNLEELYCDNNKLINLPKQPNSLEYLHCFNNELINLPELQEMIKSSSSSICSKRSKLYERFKSFILNISSKEPDIHGINEPISSDIGSNGLVSSNNLKILKCNYNKLINLSILPNNLEKLYCYDNKLVNLPILPNMLIKLNCNNNKLTRLSKIKKQLLINKQFVIDRYGNKLIYGDKLIYDKYMIKFINKYNFDIIQIKIYKYNNYI